MVGLNPFSAFVGSLRLLFANPGLIAIGIIFEWVWYLSFCLGFPTFFANSFFIESNSYFLVLGFVSVPLGSAIKLFSIQKAGSVLASRFSWLDYLKQVKFDAVSFKRLLFLDITVFILLIFLLNGHLAKNLTFLNLAVACGLLLANLLAGFFIVIFKVPVYKSLGSCVDLFIKCWAQILYFFGFSFGVYFFCGLVFTRIVSRLFFTGFWGVLGPKPVLGLVLIFLWLCLQNAILFYTWLFGFLHWIKPVQGVKVKPQAVSAVAAGVVGG